MASTASSFDVLTPFNLDSKKNAKNLSHTLDKDIVLSYRLFDKVGYMVKVGAIGACGNHLKTYPIFALVLLQVPMLSCGFTDPHRSMMRKKVVLYELFDSHTLFFAIDSSVCYI